MPVSYASYTQLPCNVLLLAFSLFEGHFTNEEAGDQSAKPAIIGQPALPPVPQPAFMTSASADKAAS